MDEWTADAFANREDPIPVLNFQGTDRSSDDDSKSDQVKIQNRGSAAAGDAAVGYHSRTHSIQDRLFAKLLQQVIPSEESNVGSSYDGSSSSKQMDRPGFSIPLMTNNFRRFNARIGVVFVFQASAIRLFSWQTPSQTLSFLAVYSLICIYPYLLCVLPLMLILLFIFVPSYLARHPPPPTPSASSPTYTLSGPPLAPPRTIKPAPEMSRDFFVNMRDLQNVMADFSVVHDLIIDTFAPLTNFSREALSSAIFLLLVALTVVLYLTAPLLPWRHLALVSGWAALGLTHPQIQGIAQKSYKTQVEPALADAAVRFEKWAEADIVIDDEPEVLEVEVFELQRQRGGFVGSTSAISKDSSASTSSHREYDGHGLDNEEDAREWEGWLFSPSAWEPQAPARIAGERPRGTRFFEDVKAPEGWAWSGKKWVLDLGSQEWVEARMMSGLEVEVEGERWVYDMKEKGGKGDWRRRRWVRGVKRATVRA